MKELVHENSMKELANMLGSAMELDVWKEFYDQSGHRLSWICLILPHLGQTFLASSIPRPNTLNLLS